jgi:hypothetical protein
MRPSLYACFIVGIAGAASAVSSCKDPTQVTVEVSTNAGADDPAVGVIAEATAEMANARASSATFDNTVYDLCAGKNPQVRCDLGELAVYTSAAKNAAVVITVALKQGPGLDACSRNPKQKGCILARRILGYAAQQTRRVKVRLDLNCDGLVC